MTHAPENPYQSPVAELLPVKTRLWSLRRGLSWAVPLAVLGFCIPYLVLWFFGFAESSRGLAYRGLAPALGCALMFAAAAVAHFTPRHGWGLVRSLSVTGMLTIVTLVATVPIAMVCGTYWEGERSTLGTFAWMFGIASCVIYLPGLVLFTFWQIRRSELDTDQPSSANQEEAGSP